MRIAQPKNENSYGGIGFFGILGILFIALKLTGFIKWSWFYVLMPIWGSLLFIGVVYIGILIYVGYKMTK